MTREDAISILEELEEAQVMEKSMYQDTTRYIEAVDMAIAALKLIPDGATNGDVIKAVFKDRDLSIITERLEHTHWWNAPYKAESEDKE